MRDDRQWMDIALAEANAAAAHDDVPVGAVLVGADGIEWSRGHNRREVDCDPSGHAEIVALRTAAQTRRSWRMDGATLYVTLEPCAMCAAALLQARIARVVYGCRDAKAGALDSLFVIGRDPRLPHRFDVVSGVQAQACAEWLTAFFRGRRQRM